MRRPRWSRSLLAGVVLAGHLAAQGGVAACAACKSAGEIDCKKHGKLVLELERRTARCSAAAECPACGGALATDCPRCTNTAVEIAAAGRREAARGWLAHRRIDIDRVAASKDLLHGDSAHVELVFSIRPLTVGRDKVDSHRLMHLYLERVEALRARFLEVLGVDDAAFSAPLQLLLFDDRNDHRALAPRLAGGGAEAAGMKLMGDRAVYSMWHDRRTVPGDDELHGTVVHNTAHLLLANMKPAQWLGNRGHGWVDEGVAHWFEDAFTGRCRTYCHEEVGVAPGAIYKGGRWRPAVRRWVEAHELEPFPAVAQLNTDQLDGQQRAQAFAYVDFLLERFGGERFEQMVRLLKRGQPTREAMRRAFDLDPIHFDAAFQAWVAAHYPLQEEKG